MNEFLMFALVGATVGISTAVAILSIWLIKPKNKPKE